MANKVRNIFWLFGIAAIVFMFLTLDVSLTEMWSCVCQVKGWIFAVLSMWIVLYVMNAWSWRIILEGGGVGNVPFMRLLKLTISGFALNYATPAGLMGGEPYKIMEVASYVGRERATSSVLLFSMTHIFSHFIYWLSSAILYLLMLDVDMIMGVILGLMIMFSMAGIYLFLKGYRNGMVVNLIKAVTHMPGLKNWGNRFLKTHRGELESIDGQIAALHNQNRSCFYKSLALEFIGRVLQGFEIFFVLMALGAEGDLLGIFADATLIIALTSLFANLLFFMPLQLGGREGGFMMSAIQLGFSANWGVFISIVCRVRELFWTSIGMLLIKVGNRKE